MATFTTARNKSQWDWTLMLMVPAWVDGAMFTTAIEEAGVKNPPPRLDDIRLETLVEGRCVQTLHIGPFDDEAEVLRQLHKEFIPDNRLRMAGRHHEIYLSDFRKVEPARQRTILRPPVTDHAHT